MRRLRKIIVWTILIALAGALLLYAGRQLPRNKARRQLRTQLINSSRFIVRGNRGQPTEIMVSQFGDEGTVVQLVRRNPWLAREPSMERESWWDLVWAWRLDGNFRGRRYSRYTWPHCLVSVRGGDNAIEVFLQHGADPNLHNAHGLAALHVAAQYEHRDAEEATVRNKIELLIRYGADINGRDADGRTPLDHAWNTAMETFLRSHGAKTGAELDAEAQR